MQLDTKYLKATIFTPEVEEQCIVACYEQLTGSWGTSNYALRSTIQGVLNRLKISTLMTPVLETSVIKQARERENGNVQPSEQVKKFLENLVSQGVTIPPLIQRDENNIIIAISWIDPQLRVHPDSQYSIITVDTTYGVIDGHFSKLSVISGITPSGEAEILCQTVLVHEYKEVFAKEMQYLADNVDPTLVDRQIVVLTDEDYGRIGAIKMVNDLL